MTHVYHLKGKIHKERIAPLLAQLFDFSLNGYQCERLANHLRKIGGGYMKLSIKEMARPKSREALGFLWGAIYRATAMELKNLSYDPDQISDDWRRYRKEGKITLDDADVADTMLRLEFFYKYAMMIGGKKVRIPKDLHDKDNPELLQYIDRIMQWRIENGLPYIDPEKYKKNRDSARLIKKGYAEKPIEYPTDNLEPLF